MGKIPLLMLLGYVVGALALGIVLSNAGPFSKYQSLAEDGVHTTGGVIQADCGNHNTFRYRFVIAGHDYESSGTAGIAKDCRTLTAGDPVQIWYLPGNPSVNMSGEPQSALRNEIVSVAMASILLPALAVFGISWKLRRRHGF